MIRSPPPPSRRAAGVERASFHRRRGSASGLPSRSLPAPARPEMASFGGRRRWRERRRRRWPTARPQQNGSRSAVRGTRWCTPCASQTCYPTASIASSSSWLSPTLTSSAAPSTLYCRACSPRPSTSQTRSTGAVRTRGTAARFSTTRCTRRATSPRGCSSASASCGWMNATNCSRSYLKSERSGGRSWGRAAAPSATA